jgi:hypothetical protein
MAESENFGISYLKLNGTSEHMFISETPGFEHGPGIIRDGLTSPRMRDPHSDEHVCKVLGVTCDPNLPYTTDPYVQRAGTWTIYHHLKRFYEQFGNEWQIVGVQSCGDLTMNPWHVAYIRNSYKHCKPLICAALEGNNSNDELFDRIYRCIVKWKSVVANTLNRRYEVLDLVFKKERNGYSVTIYDKTQRESYRKKLSEESGYNKDTDDISLIINFALAGKPVVENGVDLLLENAIDKFQDIRHIFFLPEVNACGTYNNKQVTKINFGEYQLFHDLNARRAALSSAIIIDLKITSGKKNEKVIVKWDELKTTLENARFKLVTGTPTRPGQFRLYNDSVSKDRVEIYFPHNVYPFGVLGINNDGLVLLAYGGLSGRIGSNLEGIGQMMYHYFGSDDAIVLDEGLDTFQIVNPVDKAVGLKVKLKYTNQEIISKVLSFTYKMMEIEQKNTERNNNGMREWPLNKNLMAEIDTDIQQYSKNDYDDIMLVQPHRSQMRSVIIMAVKKEEE